MQQLIDPYNRRIDYLRVSVTDRCNFRCVYCMPESGFPAMAKSERLTFEELCRLIKIGASLGIRKIRLTGGEPLVRKDLPELVRQVASVPGITDISLTTNAHLLPSMAEPLARAGLHRVNISLDTLNAEKFLQIARRGELSVVLDGIDAARKAGLRPVKVNCVLMKGLNDCEAVDFAKWTLTDELNIRFIELMPIKWNLDETYGYESFSAHGGQGLLQLRIQNGDMLSDSQLRRMYISWREIRDRIESELGPLKPAEVPTNGPARSYRLAGAVGTVGFISQISHDLCENCNRLRLTSDGYLRPCLMSDGELNLRDPMRAGASDRELADLFRHVVAHKPARHYLAEGQKVVGRGMSQIGG